MRHGVPTTRIAELAVAYRYDSVCGFDIAGAEDGYPPSRFAEAFDYLKRHNFEFTIHAGEAFGLPSIWEAVQLCNASRLGHGVRLADDIAPDGTLGELAGYIRDRRIPLELCPSSNLQTGIAGTIAEHPFGLLARLKFRVTVSCDNRLMSRTTLSREFALLSEAFDYGLADLRRFSVNAAKSAFLPFDERLVLIDRVKAGFSAAGFTA
jgi:adenosine deaminase